MRCCANGVALAVVGGDARRKRGRSWRFSVFVLFVCKARWRACLVVVVVVVASLCSLLFGGVDGVVARSCLVLLTCVSVLFVFFVFFFVFVFFSQAAVVHAAFATSPAHTGSSISSFAGAQVFFLDIRRPVLRY